MCLTVQAHMSVLWKKCKLGQFEFLEASNPTIVQ